MQLLLFYIIGGAAVLSAIIMVTNKKPVSAAMSLIITMLCLAGMYVILDAHLIAALQIIVYAGAIMVLFLFVIMLLNIKEKEGRVSGHKIFLQFAWITLVGYIFISMVKLIGGDALPARHAVSGANLIEEGIDGFGTTKAVGEILFTDYILPFEIASVLLLAAIVGAVILAKAKVD
jgi:NADH-quinone oxidoreductase subunit J